MSKNIASIIGKVVLIILLILMIIAGIFSGILFGAVFEVMKKTPIVDAENIKYEMAQNSIIVDREGNEIETIKTSEFREPVEFTKIPDDLKHAFVAVEDERFYKHSGIDVISIFGSIFENLKHRQIVRGGSTITQQLARNVFLSNDQTYERKIKEIYLALQIEKYLNKDEILGAYMNRVFLGQNSYGVQAASKTYFSKDVSELNTAQCAALAGIVKSPTYYALFKTLKKSEVTDQKVIGDFTIGNETYSAVFNKNPYEREKYVLAKMKENGYLDEKAYNEALKVDVSEALKPAQRIDEKHSNYFVDLLQNQVVQKLMQIYDISENVAWERLYYGGLKITSTMDYNIQSKLEDVYENFSEILNGNTEGLGYAPMLDLRYDDNGNIVNSASQIIFFRRNNLLDDNNDVYLSKNEAYYKDNGDFVINSNKMVVDSTYLYIYDFYDLSEKNSNLKTHHVGPIKFRSNEEIRKTDEGIVISKNYLQKHNDLIQDNESYYSINKNYYDMDLTGVTQPQSSAVVIDNSSGDIKAVVGGRDYDSNGYIFNRAYEQPRQPGSSIKPLSTYTAALDNGYTLATPIDDVPYLKLSDGSLWPKNEYGSFKGLITLKDSLKYSTNTNAISTLNKLGIEKGIEYLKRFKLISDKDGQEDHFVSKKENRRVNDENLAALSLGAMTNGMTVKDMTQAYTALANGGNLTEALTFTKIEDAKGEVIYDTKDRFTSKVTTPETAFLMTNALQTSAEYYNKIGLKDIEFAAKTGTSEDNVDFWTVGYTPYYSVGVWIGCDNKSLHLTGYSTVATSIWNSINMSILEGYKAKKFDIPKNIVKEQVDTISGKKPTDASRADPRNTVITEYFDKNNKPKGNDDKHVWVYVDIRNNLLASSKTPKDLIASRSFVDRKGSYDPSKFDYIYPEDWKYEVPKVYSDLGAPEKEKSDDKKEHSNEKEKNSTEKDND